MMMILNELRLQQSGLVALFSGLELGDASEEHFRLKKCNITDIFKRFVGLRITRNDVGN